MADAANAEPIEQDCGLTSRERTESNVLADETSRIDSAVQMKLL